MKLLNACVMMTLPKRCLIGLFSLVWFCFILVLSWLAMWGMPEAGQGKGRVDSACQAEALKKKSEVQG